jgi:hypothetical protein
VAARARARSARPPRPIRPDLLEAPPPRPRWARVGATLGRGALVAMPVLAGVVLLAVFPLRTWLAQQDAIADTRDRLARLEAENDRLEADAARLNSPAEIERRARADYNLVFPGEEAIAIIAPDPTTPPTTTSPTTTPTAPSTTP